MSQFTENVCISPLPKKGLWVTTAPLIWYLCMKTQKESIIVPKGFVFDSASVPSIFGMFIQKCEPSTISGACVHDYLYTTKDKRGRKFADDLFYEQLVACNTSKVKSFFMWLWVRLWWWWYRPETLFEKILKCILSY